MIYLVLILPVSTIITEQVCSTMMRVKTSLYNKVKDEFLTDNLIIYIWKQNC
jgi:hypothetical protein